MRLTMAKFHVLAIAAGLLLVVPCPGIAAKSTSDTKSGAKSRAGKSSASANSGSAIRPYGHDQSEYHRDDPYAPGVNWPGRWLA